MSNVKMRSAAGILVILLLFTAGVWGLNMVRTDPVRLQGAVESLMAEKLEAIQTGDVQGYMETVTRNDPYYYNEQLRWFDEMTTPGITGVSFEVEGVDLRNRTTLVATIRQCHMNGESFDFTYPLLMRFESGGWKDAGYDFVVLQRSRYTIKYMEGEPRVEIFDQMISDGFDLMETFFEVKPDASFEIKLFHDREMLRQRTIPSVTWLFTGWGEPDESLKLYTGHPQVEPYYGTILHELTHHITMKISNNNLSAWLMEGLAIYYGNAVYDLNSGTGSMGHMDRAGMAVDIAYLESFDLYHPATQQAVWDWYNASYAYACFLVERYGQEVINTLLETAGEFPFNSSRQNPEFTAQINAATREVLQRIIGSDPNTISAAYLEWLPDAVFTAATTE